MKTGVTIIIKYSYTKWFIPRRGTIGFLLSFSSDIRSDGKYVGTIQYGGGSVYSLPFDCDIEMLGETLGINNKHLSGKMIIRNDRVHDSADFKVPWAAGSGRVEGAFWIDNEVE